MSRSAMNQMARQNIAAPAGRARRALVATMAVLCWLVAAYAAVLLVAAPMRPPLMQARFEDHPWATGMHLACGIAVIALAPLQSSPRLRRNRLLHRWGGRVYAVAALASGLAGLALARVSQGGLPAHVGFALLSLAWIATTMIGVDRIRRGDSDGHRRWMSRSLALTLAAVTLRLYIPLAALLGIPEVPAYRAIAWLCRVPNLLVVEWALRTPRSPVRSAGRSPHTAGTRLLTPAERARLAPAMSGHDR